MATIVNTMERRIANSKKQNQIIQILIRSLLVGVAGYSLFILMIIGSFHLISSLIEMEFTQIGSTVLIISSIGYLTLYSFFLIREMRINNFCK